METKCESNSVSEDDYDSQSSVYSELEKEQEDECDDSSSYVVESDTEVLSDEIKNDCKNNFKSNSLTSKPDEANDKNTEDKTIVDEYAYDSSDEEDLRNTVGNIPMKWYDDLLHIGYDLMGGKIMKPVGSDEIDDFLSKMDDPSYWRTVKDKMTGQKIILSDEDVDIIQRVQGGMYPNNINRYEPFEDFFTYETMKHPVTSAPEHKRSFIPSKIEKEKVAKLVYAIKMGWLKRRAPKDTTKQFYNLWDKEVAEVSKRMQHYIPAPKMALPGHEESYNPPPEYLFTAEEEEKWNSQEPEEKKLNFIPKKYSSLRLVPGYDQFTKERFERCLDLYLCTRKRKMKVNVNPDDLIPVLPKPKDLKPFPIVQSMIYTGHSDMVRSIDVDPTGDFIASGSDDKTIKIWDVHSGRCSRTIEVEDVVKCVKWCPCASMSIILAAIGNKVYVILPSVGSKVVTKSTETTFQALPNTSENEVVQWNVANGAQLQKGIHFLVYHPKEVRQVTWHAKGDFFATLMPDGGKKAIIIHKLSQRYSQIPFQKMKGVVQNIIFHPLRPLFFVVFQRYIKIYNLLNVELTKKLKTNCNWASTIAIHPQGDNIIVGSYDGRLSWFDLEFSTKPYKTLRHHKKALRQVAFHKRYPLFASASDDGSVIVCHGMVYSDLLQNPLIVPVKVLRGHKVTHGLSVLDCCFHPMNPWIFSSGSDGTIRLFTN